MTPTIPLQTPRGHFHYRAFGPPDGFPLLMLHGWPQSSYCWKPLIPHLRGPFRIICPDLRGLGDSERSPQVEAYLKHELARDIIALLDELGIAECYLVGHDWGGATAQEMAFLIPERIRKLALLNISIIHNVKGNLAARKVLDQMGHYPSWYQYFQQQKRLPEAMIPGNEEVWLRHFLRFSNRQPFPEDAIQEYVRCYRIPGTPTSGANYYRAFRQDIARWQTYAGRVHRMPSLYIYGNKDFVILPQYLLHIEECFEQISVKHIEAGHFVQEEQARAVADCLNEFLNGK